MVAQDRRHHLSATAYAGLVEDGFQVILHGVRGDPQLCRDGPDEQKHRNLEANPQVAVTTGSTGANGWNNGRDIVVEGTALRVTDAETLQSLAHAWLAKYGQDWRFEVQGQEFVELSDSGGNTTGGAYVYRVETAKVIAFGGEHGQTTYRF